MTVSPLHTTHPARSFRRVALLILLVMATLPHRAATARTASATGPRDSYPTAFTTIDGTTYFTTRFTPPAAGLWKTTSGAPAGTGASLVRALEAPPSALTAAGPLLFFITATAQHGAELWRSDGTAAGTRLVRDINAGPEGSNPIHLTAVGDRLFFVVPAGPGAGLWISDGSAAGTIPLTAGAGIHQALVQDLTPVGSLLYFVIPMGSTHAGLWVSDGTPAGTIPLTTHLDQTGEQDPLELTAVGSRLFFSLTTESLGEELWVSDGTAATTRLVKDIRPGGRYSSSLPNELTAVGDTLYFRAVDDSNGLELWRSDGTAAGTWIVAERPGMASLSPSIIATIGNRFFFIAEEEFEQGALWHSDGTTAGTGPVWGEGDNTPRIAQTMVVGERLIWFTLESQVWGSDGTAAGTSMIRDFGVGGIDGFNDGASWQGLGFFRVTMENTGSELWRTDGTRAGTAMVADINPGPGSSRVLELTAAGDQVLFAADDGVHGLALWRTNGTSQGTWMVANLAPDNMVQVYVPLVSR
ncbi:MAG TPA: ELWxxDGT repeat protein [Herpetosiphonaceae bacterium]